MGIPRSRNSFQRQLTESGHRTAIYLLLAAVGGCMAGQLIFTNYLTTPRTVYLYVILTVVMLLIIGEALIKNPGRTWKLSQQLLYYTISLLGFAFVLPLPSPYLILMILLGLLTYFDYGLAAMNLGLGSIFALLMARFYQLHGFRDANGFSVLVVTYILTWVMAYYSTVFLRISQEELTQVERSSAKARTNEQEVQSLINNITDGVIAVDADLKVMIYNAAALDVLDLNIDIRNKRLDDFFQPIDNNGQPVDVEQLLKSTQAPVINRDLRLLYTDNSKVNLFLGLAPIYLGYGKSTNNGYTIIVRDITREKSLEEERDEFISVVSHELRTPIAISEGNIGNAEVIFGQGGDQEVIKKALKEAHNQVLFLAAMINDLATLSRAERGKLEVQVESLNVKELVDELASNYAPQAQAKGLEIKTEVAESIADLKSSKLYVREVLQNFITNAIKYTEHGSVTLKASAGENGVVFAVVDTGIGISKGDQERVFDKFFRSEDFRTRQANGTGLGLYVTMKLANLIHADIDVESELNKGSTFTITIPNLSN